MWCRQSRKESFMSIRRKPSIKGLRSSPEWSQGIGCRMDVLKKARSMTWWTGDFWIWERRSRSMREAERRPRRRRRRKREGKPPEMDRIVLDLDIEIGKKVILEGPPLEALRVQGGRAGSIATLTDAQGK